MTGIPITTVLDANEVEYASYSDEAQIVANEEAFTRDMLALNAELTYGLISVVRQAVGDKRRIAPLRISRPGEARSEQAAPGIQQLSHAEFAARIRGGEL